MNKIDFERANTLMSIISQQVNVSPMMTSIAGEASEELKEINRLAKENADERAEKIRQEETVASQRRLEAQRRDQENGDGETRPLTNKPNPIPPYQPGQPVDRPEDKATAEDKNASGAADSIEGQVQTPTPTPAVTRKL